MAQELGVGVGGLGAIGLKIAKALDQGLIPGLRLAAVSARDHEKARRNLTNLSATPPVTALADLAGVSDIIIECAPASVFSEIAEAAIETGRIFIPASVGALLPRMDLVDRAAKTGARIIIPTGALIGLDAVRAAAEGHVHSVTLQTRKPPNGLAGAPHLVANNISVEGLSEAKLVFEGTARDGAIGFPANVNVAAALSLAGIGPDKTMLQIWADPSVDRNIHTITVEADSARFTMTIENIPSEENPKTGKITALSMLATLRRLTAPLVSGT
jgi:aspartate dehydrogenase